MKQRNWIKIILLPFSWLYGSITILRNFLYDKGFLRTGKSAMFTISVGNLTVGGTGKTPMVEHITSKLRHKYNVAILSRGYGRSTTGLVFAGDNTGSADIGDEPTQYYLKYGKNVIVAVCENRVKGAQAIQSQFPERNILLLDDAFQHRAIDRNVNILLNDYSRPFYNDRPFPAGRLREARTGAHRADLVIVTKCPPDLSVLEKENIKAKISQYTATGTPVFFASVSYGAVQGFDNKSLSLNKVKVVTGIASPQPFLAFVRSRHNVLEEIIYPDHHNYTPTDFEHLIKNLKSDTFVLTTEKDMVKLRPLAEKYGRFENFAFIPITTDFGIDSPSFDDWIGQVVKV